MKAIVAATAVIAVAVLSLLAVWRALRAVGVLQTGSDYQAAITDMRTTELEDEKLRHLRSLKEIEFDHATGKIDDTDYNQLKSRHQQAAAQAIRELDAIAGEEEQA